MTSDHDDGTMTSFLDLLNKGVEILPRKAQGELLVHLEYLLFQQTLPRARSAEEGWNRMSLHSAIDPPTGDDDEPASWSIIGDWQ